MTDHLLDTRQMTRFAADGFLRWDALVPADLNEAVCRQMEEGIPRATAGRPLDEAWPDTPIAEVFRMPEIQGITRSLVGPDPLYDHHAAHLVRASTTRGPDMHQDSVIDFRENYYDIQLSFFPVDTPDEMGGTFLVPGSHFRNVRTGEIRGYQHIKGKIWATCPAGTMYVWNTRVWHGARSNHTDQDRYMYKLRLNPSQPQVRLFDTSDLDDPEIGKILSTNHGWEGNEMRYELMQRIKQWRFVSDQPDYDVGERFLRRIEYNPATAVA